MRSTYRFIALTFVLFQLARVSSNEIVGASDFTAVSGFKDVQFLNNVVEFVKDLKVESAMENTAVSKGVTLDAPLTGFDLERLVPNVPGINIANNEVFPLIPLENVFAQGGYEEDEEDCEEDHPHPHYNHNTDGELRKKKKHSKLKKNFHGDTGIFFEIGSVNTTIPLNYTAPLSNLSVPMETIRLLTTAEAAEIKQLESEVTESDVVTAAKRKKQQQKDRPKLHVGTGLFLDAQLEKDIKQKIVECEDDFCEDVDVDFGEPKPRQDSKRKKGSKHSSSKSIKSSKKLKQQREQEEEEEEEEEEKPKKKLWFWPMNVDDSMVLLAKADNDTPNLFPTEVSKFQAKVANGTALLRNKTMGIKSNVTWSKNHTSVTNSTLLSMESVASAFGVSLLAIIISLCLSLF